MNEMKKFDVLFDRTATVARYNFVLFSRALARGWGVGVLVVTFI